MSKQDLAMIFAETLEKVYSEENRHNVEEKLRVEQNFGDTPEENLVLIAVFKNKISIPNAETIPDNPKLQS